MHMDTLSEPEKWVWALRPQRTFGDRRGHLVWEFIRQGRPAYFAAVGSGLLLGCGFVATPQPLSDFARSYAIYGGATHAQKARVCSSPLARKLAGDFISVSPAFGRIVDGQYQRQHLQVTTSGAQQVQLGGVGDQR
jgi:hypothetical protein